METFPASGNLVGTTDAQTLTNKTLSCSANTCTNIPTTALTGTLQAAQFPALTGDLTTAAGSLATTLATVNPSPGTTACSTITTNGKGLVTSNTSGSCTPVVFVGAATNSGNAYSIASPTPGGFTLANQYAIRTVIPAGGTNTGPATLNVNATGAAAIETNTSGGLAPLVSGELQANLEYDLAYNTSCTCYVISALPQSAFLAGTSQTVSPAQWAAFSVFTVTSSGQTLTLPGSSGLSSNGGLGVITIGQSVILTPGAGDAINGGAAGASVTVPVGVFAMLVKSSPGNISVAPLAAPPVAANPTATIGASRINGVATTFMRSDAAPAIAANAISNALLAQAPANTIKGNATASAANEQDISVPSCPDSGGNHLNWTSGGGLSCGSTASGGNGTINPGSSPAVAQYQGTNSTTLAPAAITGDAKLAAGGALTVASIGGVAPGSLYAASVGNGLTVSGGTLNLTQLFNNQTGGNYTVSSSDLAKMILVGGFTYTLPQAGTTGFGSGWGACFLNTATSPATIATTGSAFNGAGGGTSLVLEPGGFACPASDGTNYDTPASHFASGVTAGSYTNANITVDAAGRVMAASNGSGGNGVGLQTPGYTSGNWILPFNVGFAPTTGLAWQGTGYIYCRASQVLQNMHVSALGATVLTAGSTNLQLAVYSVGSNGNPYKSAIASTGNIANTSSGSYVSGTVTSAALTAGTPYWFCAMNDDTKAAFESTSNGSSYDQALFLGGGGVGAVMPSNFPSGILYTGGTYGTWPTFTGSESWSHDQGQRTPIIVAKIGSLP